MIEFCETFTLKSSLDWRNLASREEEDFRSYVYDVPFSSDGEEVTIPGYEFKKNLFYKSYPLNYEVDEEELGDENIQNPYESHDNFD